MKQRLCEWWNASGFTILIALLLVSVFVIFAYPSRHLIWIDLQEMFRTKAASESTLPGRLRRKAAFAAVPETEIKIRNSSGVIKAIIQARSDNKDGIEITNRVGTVLQRIP